VPPSRDPDRPALGAFAAAERRDAPKLPAVPTDALHHLRARLLDLVRGWPLSAAAAAEADRLLTVADAAELERVVDELTALARWEPAPCAPFDDADRAECERLVVELAELRDARRAEHERRIAALARRLGGEVAAHRVLLADAEEQIARLLDELADDPLPIPLLPWADGLAIARREFRAAYDAERRAREAAA
jgi:hypothetical protein